MLNKLWNSKKLLFILLINLFILESISRILLYQTHLVDDYLQWGSTSWKIRWLKRNNSEHVDQLLKYEEFDKILGWKPKKNFKRFDKDSSLIISTDQNGFRTTSLDKASKAIGSILFIGDSYTFGDEVSDQESFPFLVQSSLQNYKVYNLGVRGYGLDQILLRYRRYKDKFTHKIVVLGFVYDDLLRNGLSFREYIKPFFTFENGSLVLNNSPVLEFEHYKKEEFFHSKFIDIVEVLLESYDMRTGQYFNRPIDISKKILSTLVDEIREQNAVPLFVYLPTSTEATRTKEKPSRWEKLMFEFCEIKSVDCISASSGFVDATVNQKLKFPINSHWLFEGHKIVSDLIINKIQEIEGL